MAVNASENLWFVKQLRVTNASVGIAPSTFAGRSIVILRRSNIIPNEFPFKAFAQNIHSRCNVILFLKGCNIRELTINFANSPPRACFIMNLYQLDEQSTKFTIWKY